LESYYGILKKFLLGARIIVPPGMILRIEWRYFKMAQQYIISVHLM
jgi:hypothetical protein